MKIRWSSLALAELNAILSDLAAKNPTAAQRFEFRVRQIVQRIERFPEAFQAVSERVGVRRVPLLRYPYLIFYSVDAAEVVILRVFHGARKEPWENL
jgi:plasmid stabilization system protein ParE